MYGPQPGGWVNTPVGMHGTVELTQHQTNVVLSIGALIIPYVGPLLSAGINLYDAKLWYDEGDKYTAGLIGMFSLLPAAGLLGKLGLGKWTGRQLAELGKKIGLGKTLSSAEVEAVKKIAQNKQLIQNELKKYGDITLRQAKQKARQTAQWQATKRLPWKGVKWTGKNIVAPAVAYDVGYNALYPDEQERTEYVTKPRN